VLVVSPHCDDAVFGCGQLLAARPGAVVVTVFAGAPSSYATVTRWDTAAGFGAGDDVMAARRAEDHAALERLGARPLWLPFLDSQYGATPTILDVAGALDLVIGDLGPDTVVVPLGLFHSDHAIAHEAALALLARHRHRQWLAYEDALYRRIAGLIDARLARLAAADVAAEPAGAMPAGALERKREAVACYRSQLRALAAPGHPGYADAFAPEGYRTLRARRG
jgi:LmbE family N-acetylglucosaminyl deacetylase